MSDPLSGVLPVVQTPFADDDSVDHGALRNEVAWALEQGVDGFTVAMVSEYLRLSEAERIDVSRTVIEAATGRPVVVSVGAESTSTARALATQAEAVGAAALMAIPPLSVQTTEPEISRYYEALLGAVEIPVVVQDASGYVGQPLTTELQASLFTKFGDRVLFKPEALPIGPRLSELRDATGGQAKVFEGIGGVALIDSFRRRVGVVGTMPSVDVCWVIVALWQALNRGDMDTADAIHGPLGALVFLQDSLDSYVAIEKHLLVRQGVIESDRVRGPLGFVIDDETRQEVDRVFDRLRAVVDSIPA